MNATEDRTGDAADRHVPVLLQRCVDLLAPALTEPGAVLVDCTLGMGGHTEGVLEQIPTAHVIGIDRDPEALRLASERLARFGDRFTPVHAVYDEIADVVAEHTHGGPTPGAAQGVLMDLGVSSLQLDETDRGFAYAQDAPLDMRMDPTRGQTAADVLNTYDERELARILREYGEERFAPKIARAIVRRRESAPWERSGDLVDLLRATIPAATRKTGGHPGKRTFQALRIEVNGEIEVLERAVPAAIEVLAVGGRIVVESYHSLEDRIVKRAIQRGTTSSAPPGLPVEPETHKPYLEALTRGAETADEPEIERNPRSASVRLRAARRLRPTPDHLRDSHDQRSRPVQGNPRKHQARKEDRR
ncbi:16S rRNA (cytosine(1402)-N(4))-methyltransferase RsmH [Myceligenerans indicum]|uniref:Ribosomal RNA small subunit methyltransferase H n=1 Tax=Myceligenerans indicum TaxID=2593663 RepID=A0ABS1LMJ7_9MICO|nr:16S rRNA (cytosine(1402)-N(4))-methyltransferase RsmH [Myceligenerans indicum]MBL0887431.1 16S rRNA (cytosine(1402)-N(4))-methyltransferase RsmH [Myceligenerans indicum]